MKKKNSKHQFSTELHVPVSGTPIWQPLLIFLFSFLLYANTLSHEFVFDDYVVIVNNSLVQKGFSGISDLLTKDSFFGYFHDSNDLSGGRYRPLSLLSFAIGKELFGSNPHAEHFLNVLIYALSILMLFFTLRKIFPTSLHSLPFLISLLFASHPIHTEVVANIKSRDELLSFFFLTSTLFFLFNYSESRKLIHLVYSVFCYLLALLSKENAITFLMIIPLALFFFTNKNSSSMVRTVLPFLILAILFLSARSYFAGTVGDRTSADIMDNPFLHASVSEKLATITGITGRYLVSSLFPIVMAYDYSYNQIPVIGWADWHSLASLVAILCLCGVTWIGLRQKSVFSFSILYFFITISIVSNVFFPVGAPMADRFLFLPSLGSCMLIGFIFSAKSKEGASFFSVKNKISAGLFILLIGIYSAKTFDRNLDWKSNFTLFEADVKVVPENVRARVNFGSLLLSNAEKENDRKKKSDLLGDAFKHFTAAVRIHPGYADAFNHLGSYYSIVGQKDSAILNFQEAVRLKPGFHSFENNLANAFLVRGNSFLTTKNYSAAIDDYRRTLLFQPMNTDVYNNLSVLFMNSGMPDSAEYYFKESIRINSENKNAKVNLANLYLKEGNDQLLKNNNEDALRLYSLAIEQYPEFSDAWSNAGMVFYRRKYLPEAIRYFSKAFELRPTNKIAAGNLVKCYTATGNTAQAERFRAIYDVLK